eukprot:6196472-Pleurochrysis_carterae.AAC.4
MRIAFCPAVLIAAVHSPHRPRARCLKGVAAEKRRPRWRRSRASLPLPLMEGEKICGNSSLAM